MMAHGDCAHNHECVTHHREEGFAPSWLPDTLGPMTKPDLAEVAEAARAVAAALRRTQGAGADTFERIAQYLAAGDVAQALLVYKTIAFAGMGGVLDGPMDDETYYNALPRLMRFMKQLGESS
jgi:hypothetical protein